MAKATKNTAKKAAAPRKRAAAKDLSTETVADDGQGSPTPTSSATEIVVSVQFTGDDGLVRTVGTVREK